jgi:hypothetical protein
MSVLHFRTMSTESPIAVIDTNVMLDVYSCADLARQYELDEDVSGPQATFRRARARESLLLAIHLHSVEATTYGLEHEVPRILRKMADPEASETLETNFTKLFLYFVKDNVLSGWDARCVIGWDLGIKGTQADDRLLALAQKHDLPLITNEGYTKSGIQDEKLRMNAQAKGVPVFTPREFYEGKLDEPTQTQAFFQRFADRAPAYIETHEREFGPSEIRDFLPRMLDIYRHILTGETEGHGFLPVKVDE